MSEYSLGLEFTDAYHALIADEGDTVEFNLEAYLLSLDEYWSVLEC